MSYEIADTKMAFGTKFFYQREALGHVKLFVVLLVGKTFFQVKIVVLLVGKTIFCFCWFWTSFKQYWLYFLLGRRFSVFCAYRNKTNSTLHFPQYIISTKCKNILSKLGQHEVFRWSSCSWQDIWLKQKNCAFWFMVRFSICLDRLP